MISCPHRTGIRASLSAGNRPSGETARAVVSELPPPPPEEKQVEKPTEDDEEDKGEDIERWRRIIQEAELTGNDYDIGSIFAPMGNSLNPCSGPPAGSAPPIPPNG